tara:strand:+ start:581 stop:1060 length:480 start_codon:yes stop_codon:yes gene_type:complete
MTEYNDPLTGTVKEKYTTGSGKHGLIIDCDNPNFKFPVKAYDGTFGATLGLNVFVVGDKVEFKFQKSDFGNQFTQCNIVGGHQSQPSQPDTSFNHGANVKPDQERVVSNGSENKYNNYLSEIAEAYEAIENFPIIQNLDQENKRAIAISAVINQMRNGR